MNKACVGVLSDKGGITCKSSLCSFAMQREQVTVHLPKKDVHGKSQHQKSKGRSRTHQSDPLNPLGRTGAGSVVFWVESIVCDVCNALLQTLKLCNMMHMTLVNTSEQPMAFKFMTLLPSDQYSCIVFYMCKINMVNKVEYYI